MTPPSQAQWHASRRFLDYDGHDGRPALLCAEAAARLHERLRLGLGPLIGAGGFDALYARSVNLAAAATVGDARGVLKIEPTAAGRAQLHDYLALQEPIVAADLAAAVFANFFALMTTFVGVKLTAKILLEVGLPLTSPQTPENES